MSKQQPGEALSSLSRSTGYDPVGSTKLKEIEMTDVISSTAPMYTTTIGDHHQGHHDNYGEQKILESIGNAALHQLNAQGITNKAIADSATDILLDNATLKNQITQTVDTIHTDGSATRADVKSEGRNLDNKVSDAERASAAQANRTDYLVQENKFETTKQNFDNARYLSDKFAYTDSQTRHDANQIRQRLFEQTIHIDNQFKTVELRQAQDKFELYKEIERTSRESERQHDQLHRHVEKKTDEVLKHLADQERRNLEEKLHCAQSQLANAQLQGQLAALSAGLTGLRQETVNFGSMSGTSQSAPTNTIR